MKTKPNATTEVAVNVLSLLHNFYAGTPAGTRDLDDLLAFIYQENAAGRHLRVTDLVRLQHFGSLPTLTHKVQRLITLGLVVQTVAGDRREKNIEATPAAELLFQSRYALLQQAGLQAA